MFINNYACKKQPRIYLERKVDDKVAIAYNILGTNIVCFTAYEPSALTGNHSVITALTEDGEVKWYGEIAARRLPAEILDAPHNQEKHKKINALMDVNIEEGFSVILRAFPELSQFAYIKYFSNLEIHNEEGCEFFQNLKN